MSCDGIGLDRAYSGKDLSVVLFGVVVSYIHVHIAVWLLVISAVEKCTLVDFFVIFYTILVGF